MNQKVIIGTRKQQLELAAVLVKTLSQLARRNQNLKAKSILYAIKANEKKSETPHELQRFIFTPSPLVHA